MAVDLTYCRPASHDRAYFAEPTKLLAGRIDPPAFNLRNDVMVAKHVNATIIAGLHRYCRDPARPQVERDEIESILDQCLPRRVEPYLFEGGVIRSTPFDSSEFRNIVARNCDALAADVEGVFKQVGRRKTSMSSIQLNCATTWMDLSIGWRASSLVFADGCSGPWTRSAG